jgi:hypothetical protein
MNPIYGITFILLFVYVCSLAFALRVKDRALFGFTFSVCTLLAAGGVAFAVGWSNHWAGWSDGSASADHISNWVSAPILVGGLCVAASGLARSARVFWAFQASAYLAPFALLGLLPRPAALIMIGSLDGAFIVTTLCLLFGRYRKKESPNQTPLPTPL